MLLDLFEMALDHVVDRITDSLYDSSRLGKYGEKLTERELRLIGLFGRKGKILKNVYLPTEDGGTSEIDLLYITQKGIFVIESKNYSGWIFGNEKDQFWTQSLPDGYKNRFYNPIKQNRTHMKWLGQFLGRDVPMFSFIVFSERCELKKVTFETENVDVMNRDELYAAVRDVWSRVPDVLSDEEVAQIHASLIPLTNVDAAAKQAHIDAIRSKLHPEEPVCPKCGARLVVRTARHGANAGNQFYGCSAFPKCRYTQNITEK